VAGALAVDDVAGALALVAGRGVVVDEVAPQPAGSTMAMKLPSSTEKWRITLLAR